MCVAWVYAGIDIALASAMPGTVYARKARSVPAWFMLESMLQVGIYVASQCLARMMLSDALAWFMLFVS